MANFKILEQQIQTVKSEALDILFFSCETTADKLEALRVISENDLLPRDGWYSDGPKTLVDDWEDYFHRYETKDFYEWLSRRDEDGEDFDKLVDEIFDYVRANERIGTKLDW